MEGEESSLTPSACGMLQVLSARLMQLKDLLAETLFAKAWHSLASQLCQVSRTSRFIKVFTIKANYSF
jgi:hypothetical protein